MRRHLWANTSLAGESFEYTGTGKELLIGFLIALAIVVPLNIGYFLIGILLEEKQAFLSAPVAIFLYGLAQYASYRALRYRASRTVFRGLRFWMSGCPGALPQRSVTACAICISAP
jgi:uncharacterized membrane protein YjgN (DUF898 family)